MPKLKHKSARQRNTASRELMRKSRIEQDAEHNNHLGCCKSVIFGDMNKQMEVDPRLSKPSGPSVLEDLPDAVHDALRVDLFDEIPAVTDKTNKMSYDLCNIPQDESVSYDMFEMERIVKNKSSPLSLEEEIIILPDCNINPNYLSLNQRPHNSHLFILGSFSQFDDRFCEESRGSQCTVNALCSLIYAKFSNIYSQQILDSILLEGDALYNKVILGLKQRGMFKSKLLNFEELPNVVSLLSKDIMIEKFDVISGTCVQLPSTEGLPSLTEGLNIGFVKSEYLLLMIGSICSAVFKKDSMFYFFDSHSHSQNGLSGYIGRSILITFNNLNDLVSYLYALYDSMHIDITTQFDILPLNPLVHDVNLQTITPAISKYKQVHKNVVDNQGKMKSDENEKQNKGCLKTTSINSKNDEKTSLISQYFKDQNNKRKEYQKLYKQKQRMSENFKRSELIAKSKKRKDASQNIKERLSTKHSMEKSRLSVDFQLKERELKKTIRNDEEMKKVERCRTSKSMKKLRHSLDFKRKERDMKQNVRQSEQEKNIERCRTSKSMKKRRHSSDFKQKERDMKQNVRQSEQKKNIERCRTSKSMKKLRHSLGFKLKERDSKRKCRQDQEYREHEAEQKREKRVSYDFKKKEIEIQNKSKRKARKVPINLEKERVAKQRHRGNEKYRKSEQNADRSRKIQQRQNQDHFELESLSSKCRKYGSDVESCIELFHKNISVGPIYICCCCHQTWFHHSVSKVNSLSTQQQNKYLTNMISVDNKRWICTTCRNNIKENKVPKLSVLNGMQWPIKPKELELFPLEERLISLRIPFMQIRELPRGRQLSIKGNVVNVPVEIQPVADALPRPLDENVTIAVKLKKRMSFKSCVFTENIRPLRVLVALHWLLKHSILYKNAHVKIDEEWIRNVTEECSETVREFLSDANTSNDVVQSDKTRPLNPMTNNLSTHSDQMKSENFEQYDSDAEENAEENVGNIDTLLDDANIENRNCTYTFAPGEGQQPLSIYRDTDSEFLCFPSIFCGQRRKENHERSVPVHYSDIAKWELRSEDRRAANSVPNIFFKLKKIQMKQLNDKVNLAMRRCQKGSSLITAAQARDSNCLDSIVRKDDGYYIFKQIRNSPAYLESRKKDVFAMMRQLGVPTWFISLSSADTRWTDLLKMLASLNKKVNYSDEEIANLTWDQKIKLIQSDPVTCSRYFDNRVQEFITSVLKSHHNPLGKLSDFFYRIEFQQRGSPHVHMVAWIENAPKLTDNTNEEIVAFVDTFLQCSRQDEDIGNLVDIQIHQHSRTCRKKQDKICRFGYPLPPLPCTMVLHPIESDKDKNKYNKMYQELQKKMNDQKEGYNMTYHEFLKDVAQMSENDYILCIRSSLNSSKVFLKRHPSEIRVNLYNKTILKAWKANIDIQFVLDPYACAMYIVSYISKSQRGMSNLMYAAAKEARNGNMDIKNQVRHIGNVFSNSVEVGAQEAVYLILQMPLTKSTRDVVFINTSTADNRLHMLKPKAILDEMPPDSTKIMSQDVIKKYSIRPKALENWCLADYVSQLDIVYPEGYEISSDENQNDDAVIESDIDETFQSEHTVLTLKVGIKIKRRNTHKVIRYVRFNIRSDEENHFREKMLLFYPWRDEDVDLIGNFNTYKDHYNSKKNMIDSKCKDYEHHAEEIELAKDMAEADYDAYDELAPGTQQMEADTNEEEPAESETFVYFNPDRVSEHRNYDIGVEINCAPSVPQITTNQIVLPEGQYRQLLRSLNQKQMMFHDHVVHWIKTKDAPLYEFLSGGAGVGKSVVIRALYQTLYRFLNLKEGDNSEEIKVLLCAYTGKAAFNIGGSTISSAFKQKFKQSNQTLTCDSLNTFRSKFRELSVVIIDEISMVGNGMLSFIDQRLQELKGTRTPFGGVSIIAVGDLYQLKPVNGDWIFNDLVRDTASLAANLWKDYFKMFELTEIMRQKDDLEFAEILNRLRINALTDEDMLKLDELKITPENDHYQLNSPHLFAENYFMHLFNDSIITCMQAEKVIIPCFDSIISPNLSKHKQEEAISRLPTDPNKTANLHCSLTVVIGMIYDITVNVNTEDGLANGASCVVKLIEYKQKETNRPSIIWVKFDDAQAGKETRAKYQTRGFYHKDIDIGWTPVFDIEKSFVYNKKTFQRIQFPLQPSAGRSVHRAQGSTLESVVIDLSQRRARKVPHLHYVALSRVTSMKNLQILNFNEKALKVDEQVVAEMKRLRENVLLDLSCNAFCSVDEQTRFKIAFNNCRSLHLHIDDIRHNKNLLSSHIFAVAESRLYYVDKNCDYEIDGFKLYRNDQETNCSAATRPHHGLAVYIRNEAIVQSELFFSSRNVEFSKFDVHLVQQEKQIVILYKAPNTSNKEFVNVLDKELLPHISLDKALTVVGDFNIYLIEKHQQFLKTLCEKFSCEMLMQEPTTDNHSTLDLVFSNEQGIAGTEETYWSDHKIIFFHTQL